jgi:hypothetical protein
MLISTKMELLALQYIHYTAPVYLEQLLLSTPNSVYEAYLAQLKEIMYYYANV